MHNSPSIAPEDLGHLLGVFNWHKAKAKRLFIIWSLTLPVALISCLFLVGIPGSVMAFYFARRSWRRWRSAQPVVVLYQHGLVDQRQNQPIVLPYANVDTLTVAVNRLAGITSYTYTLQTKDNHKIQFDEHLAQIKDLGFILQEQIAQQKLPETIAAYQQGQPIDFKHLVITADGITAGKRFLPWHEFEGATLTQTRSRKHIFVFVEIRQKDQQLWASFNQSTFPNLALFFALLNYIQASR